MTGFRTTSEISAKGAILLLLCSSVLLLFPATGFAANVDELQDDFSGGSWKDCLWRPYERLGAGPEQYFDGQTDRIQVNDDKLELRVPSRTNAGLSWEMGLMSKFELDGDFDVRVDFEFDFGSYWTNLDIRGINMLFVELMGSDVGARRRHVRTSYLDEDSDLSTDTTAEYIWLSNDYHDRVTMIDTQTQVVRELPAGERPARTAVNLNGDAYIHNRGGYIQSNGSQEYPTDAKTTVTFVKASECAPDCDFGEFDGGTWNPGPDNSHIYTIDFEALTGSPIQNGIYGGGVAVDSNNDLWVAFRSPGVVYHLQYNPSPNPGGDTWTHENTIDVRGEFNNEVINIYGMAFSSTGKLWLTTRGAAVEALISVDPDTGDIVRHTPPGSMANCIDPYGLALDSQRRLIWGTHGSESDCKGLRLDPSDSVADEDRWTFLESDPLSAQQRSRGIAADRSGRVFVAGYHAHRVARFSEDSDGIYQSDMILNNSSPNAICNNPAGVALDRNELLWVSCWGNHSLDDRSPRVMVFDAETGTRLASIDTLRTYSYSDTTGYQLRNFGLDDWEESFTDAYSEISNGFYVSSVENNYGGGQDWGAGGNVAIDPDAEPFTFDFSGSTVAVPEVSTMRVSSYYHTDRLFRIVNHPARLEGLRGFRTPATADLNEVPFNFTVAEDAYVYIAYDERPADNQLPNWLRSNQGWEKQVGEVVVSSDDERDFSLYRQEFNQGDLVELGAGNRTQGQPPPGAPYDNYFVYVYPKNIDIGDPGAPPGMIDEPAPGEVLASSGSLRIIREGSQWTFNYRDGGSTLWRGNLTRDFPTRTGPTPIRLRTRLDPFWHSGAGNDRGGPIRVRFDNFAVTSADSVPIDECRECDVDTPGYGDSCFGGSLGLCPGVMECVEEVLTCVSTPGTERCNGFDDDCDGTPDYNHSGDDFPIQDVTAGGITHTVHNHGMPGPNPNGGGDVTEGSMCTSDLSGPCAEGFWQCVDGAMQCNSFQAPREEICDGEDNSCDGQANEDLSDPLSRLGRYVQAQQRSLPNTPIRPIVPENGENFETFVGFDGNNVNPQIPNLVEEGVARIILYLDPTRNADGGNDGLGDYVLYLAHGAATPDQGAASASYSMTYGHSNQVGGLIMQDGIVKEQAISNPPRSQYVTVQSGAGESGGVALGTLDSTGAWDVVISTHFAGDIHRWELYNAVTGEGIELSANEALRLSNNSLDGLQGHVTSEVGQPCDTGEPGICGRGASRCEQDSDGNWGMNCRIAVVEQLEVCDGRDNSCSGDVDFNEDYGFALPVPQYQQISGMGDGQLDEDAWENLVTVDMSASAVDFMNFDDRSSEGYGAQVGSPDMRDVAEPTRSLQRHDRSVWTIHRDTRVGNGTLALAMAHGRYIEGAATPSSTATFDITMDHKSARESFLAWFDDMEDQQDGSYFTGADHFESQNPNQDFGTGGDTNNNAGTPFYRAEWELHRWVAGSSARREADGGVIMDLFAETTDRDPNSVIFDVGTTGITDWKYYSPYHDNDGFVDLDLDQRIGFRIVPALAGDYSSPDAPTCIIQENDNPSCLGQLDVYTCQDGQIVCGIDTDGCCNEEHPMYDEPCGLDDPAFINEGACRSAMRCTPEGGWECQQVQWPHPEMCSGQDDTCDGIVDGFHSGFVHEEAFGGDGSVVDCPDGASICGPQECNFRQSCVCNEDFLDELGRPCICSDALGEMLMSPYERICENHERLQDDECVAVATMPED